MSYKSTQLARLKDIETMGTGLKSEIDEATSKRTLTFTFPEQHITSPITLDFQNCVFSHIDDNPEFDIVIVDAEDKVICGKRR